MLIKTLVGPSPPPHVVHGKVHTRTYVSTYIDLDLWPSVLVVSLNTDSSLLPPFVNTLA